jgi:dTDP-4-dehydrorhamnose reductase
MTVRSRILLLGNSGQLGWELERALGELGGVTALDYPEIDLARDKDLRSAIRHAAGREGSASATRPFDLIVNAAAYTDVDRAESERDLAVAVNGKAPGILAEEARAMGAALVHYSTDYVFDGAKGSAYVETDQPNPLNAYGGSKLVGERAVSDVGGAHLIIRTAWLYSLRRPSFVTKVLRWAADARTKGASGRLKIVDDQISNPTWARALAEATVRALAAGLGESRKARGIADWIAERSGIYHLAGDGCASRFDWAEEILMRGEGTGAREALSLLRAKTADFPSPAARPLLSALDCAKFLGTFGFKLSPWQEAMTRAFREAEMPLPEGQGNASGREG